jgi:hypothetical protein
LGGISWGTVLALSAPACHPGKLHAYVGLEQIANWVESDELAHRWTLDRAEEAGNRKAVEQHAAIGPRPGGASKSGAC